MGIKIIVSIVVLILAYVANHYYSQIIVKSPIVEISTGKLQGKVSKSRDGREFFEYLNIPFAKPPVGELRFEPPIALTEKWEGVRDATAYGSVCLQYDTIFKKIDGSEDCLSLNVYSNVHSSKLKNANLPVLIWIHGGLFAMGAGSEYSPDYFLEEDLVFVSINYRLASLGFLNTGDGIIRGNMGLKDQQVAIKWVNDNIAVFGGNPKDVTIFGESAGAASVHFQMLSLKNKGLFNKVISQSGLATQQWSLTTRPTEQAKRFASQLKCTEKNTKEMVKCLKSKSALEIAEVHKEIGDHIRPEIAIFLPTIEKDIPDGNKFLAQDPKTLIETGNFLKVPFMAGINSAEGLIAAAPVVTNKTLFTLLSKNWEKTLPSLSFLPENTDPKTLEKFRKFYIDGNGKLDPENPLKHLENLTNLFSDSIFNIGFVNGINSHKKHISSSNPLFLYYYTYDGEFNLADLFRAMKGDYHPIIEIIQMKIGKLFNKLFGPEPEYSPPCHGDELALLFKLGFNNVENNSKDYEFSKQMVKLWVQFAKSDIKSLNSLEFMGQKWPSQESNKPLKYMQLDISPKIIDQPGQDRIAFWNSL